MPEEDGAVLVRDDLLDLLQVLSMCQGLHEVPPCMIQDSLYLPLSCMCTVCALWQGPTFSYLGLSCCVIQDMPLPSQVQDSHQHAPRHARHRACLCETHWTVHGPVHITGPS